MQDASAENGHPVGRFIVVFLLAVIIAGACLYCLAYLPALPGKGWRPGPGDAGQARVDRRLFSAVRDGSTDEVERLLGMGARADAVNFAGTSPLHVAVKRGHGEILRLLLDNGADPESSHGPGGTTVLHTAVTRPPILATLLAYGGNPDVRDGMGRTPLHLCAQRGKGGLEFARLLIKKGADVNAKADDGQTPLDKVGIYPGGPHPAPLIRLLRRKGAKRSGGLP